MIGAAEASRPVGTNVDDTVADDSFTDASITDVAIAKVSVADGAVGQRDIAARAQRADDWANVADLRKITPEELQLLAATGC